MNNETTNTGDNMDDNKANTPDHYGELGSVTVDVFEEAVKDAWYHIDSMIQSTVAANAYTGKDRMETIDLARESLRDALIAIKEAKNAGGLTPESRATITNLESALNNTSTDLFNLC